MLTALAFVRLRHRPGRGRRLILRATAVATTTLAGLVLAEFSCALYASWLHRAPRLSMTNAPARAAGPDQDATIVVVGESSAEGVPYKDWLSVGKLVVWQLRWLFPRRMFHLEVQARPGWTLEQMHQRLAESRQRPDAVILYAGHNEFASRHAWSSEVPYYRDDPPAWWTKRLAAWVTQHSPLCRLVHESRERMLVALPPEPRPRSIADVPSHTLAEHRERLEDFRRRLQIMLADLQASGVLTVVIIPPGNDAGYEPNRSLLPADLPMAQRQEFVRQVEWARALEAHEPEQSMERYRALIAQQPGFAETHFRLARMLEQAGRLEEAYREYVRARDLDGHPMRCVSSFQDVYRTLAPRYGAVLVDGQAVFHARHACGQLDDALFHDAMHPSLEGHLALAESVLAALKSRGAFGWPAGIPAPALDPSACARHFDLTPAAWKEVCRFAARFYRTTLRIRFDAAERTRKAQRYELAGKRLEGGAEADSLNLAGVGVKPACRGDPLSGR